ncbi:hypothetical protein ANSO36C_67740 (plasmid) [Nostoc cf. commune SO-36]|uniref:Uncharacterized protein n=1 Tax=Nostoc cf. commune SO-36 TaxID=449208 RepID=A0ABM7ZCD1_NOSCO|nr:hypothetical protein [Nostoc commune]BDI20972.1 hypothetical protein ANSO36C_67740 [Nostoc cf. commune SO-36]
MTLEQAIALLNECLEKLNKVFESKDELLHWHENFGNSLETAMTLVENCISDLSTDNDE